MPTTKSSFLKLVQKRIANTSVGASTLRGMAPGTGPVVTDYLANLDLGDFTGSVSRFQRALDRKTDALAKRMPGRHWGAARKFLNLFLREAIYNRYLCQAYGLQRLERSLEVPLDSSTAKGLKRDAGRGVLPRWPGIKWLDRDTSRQFQEFASQAAHEECINRVHLDLVY